jgi:hypothetical protein
LFAGHRHRRLGAAYVGYVSELDGHLRELAYNPGSPSRPMDSSTCHRDRRSNAAALDGQPA